MVCLGSAVVCDEELAMIKLNERYLTDADGNRIAVVLDLEAYEELLDVLEELEDIRDAEAAKAEDLNGLPLDQALIEIEKERATRENLS